MLIGLRTIWGCELTFIEKQLSEKTYLTFLNELNVQIENGFIIKKEQQLFLTEKGKLFADRVASDLFVE